jgi:DNA-binding transcriptional ArsR family regulator
MTQGTALPAATIDAILSLRAAGLSVGEVAERTGVSRSAITRYGRVLRSNGSGRDRVLRAIVEHGPVDSILALSRLLGGDLDPHSVRHLVHSLHRAGEIDFTEGTRGRPGAIRARQHLLDAMDGLRLRVLDGAGHEVAATLDAGGNIVGPDQLHEEVEEVADEFPSIRALVARRDALLSAARTLEEVGEVDLAVEALAKAELSAFEAEAVRLFERCGAVGGRVRVTSSEHQP